MLEGLDVDLGFAGPCYSVEEDGLKGLCIKDRAQGVDRDLLFFGEGIFDRAQGVAGRGLVLVADPIDVFADFLDPTLADEFLADCGRDAGSFDCCGF